MRRFRAQTGAVLNNLFTALATRQYVREVDKHVTDGYVHPHVF